jgi:ribonuclease D
LSDESLLEICRKKPKTVQELSELRGVNNNIRRHFDDILAAVKRGVECPEDQWPRLVIKPRLSAGESAAVELMAAIVRIRSSENKLPSSVLASRAMLEELAQKRDESAALLQGWRKDIVGAELVKLLCGQLLLGMANSELEIIDIALVGSDEYGLSP